MVLINKQYYTITSKTKRLLHDLRNEQLENILEKDNLILFNFISYTAIYYFIVKYSFYIDKICIENTGDSKEKIFQIAFNFNEIKKEVLEDFIKDYARNKKHE